MTRLGYRHCNRCDRDLTVDHFYRARRTGRIEGRCKDCRREVSRGQYQAKLATTGIQG